MSASKTTGAIETRIVKLFLRASILWVALIELKSIGLAVKTLLKLIRYRMSFQGERKTIKFVRSPGGYHLALNVPKWPSRAFFDFIRNELHRINDPDASHWILTLIFSVTSKCNLNCAHCFEWDNLARSESLTLDELKKILARFQDSGIGQVQISGGEPLLRLQDTLELVRTAEGRSEFWLLSSGYGLTQEVAKQLKLAGYLGVNLSLDHWDSEKHNTFRGKKDSFDWVKKAAGNVVGEGLQLAFSLCVSEAFVSRKNLLKYCNLAKSLGAGFIQLLEPRAAGRYAHKQVELSAASIQLLSDFYVEMNTDPVNRHLPMIMYPGYHQRKHGCFGAGLRMLHMDPNGNLHACPFCRKEIGNSLHAELPELIENTRLEGCQVFDMAEMHSNN